MIQFLGNHASNIKIAFSNWLRFEAQSRETIFLGLFKRALDDIFVSANFI